ncbi:MULTISPECIES: helix-turn-helix transcriptional regulator [unclassified Solwaraspora]|uniref:helix-turn-helix transcriptional regulator n=1 Tax=unclassified Solwaraspora TaxID=2627926 RepID=UPI00259AEEC1|nr:YafY family protein [Solwaraspora sp. WMMA2056]WJK41358.1 YafY family protein [Solwaraspora sp. WMMA2056]
MPKTSARLLALLSLLQTRRDWSGAALVDRLDVSLRTVRRDIDRLRELGYPIAAVKGPEGGYRLAAGTNLPPLLFDDEQAVALTVALQIAATTPDSSLAEPAARALNTIRQVLPSRLRHRVQALDVTVVNRPSTRPAEPVHGDVLLAISSAVHARQILRFDYGYNDTMSLRRVEPHHVITREGRWYLVAWDLDRADWRIFRVDRISPRTPHGPHFTPRALPGGDLAEYVTGVFRGSVDASGRWPCQGTVTLDLPASVVAVHAGDGIVEQTTPDRCRLTLGSWSWPSLAAAIARYDADITVIGPDELAEAFVHLAHRFSRAVPGHAAAPTASPPLWCGTMPS